MSTKQKLKINENLASIEEAANKALRKFKTQVRVASLESKAMCVYAKINSMLKKEVSHHEHYLAKKLSFNLLINNVDQYNKVLIDTNDPKISLVHSELLSLVHQYNAGRLIMVSVIDEKGNLKFDNNYFKDSKRVKVFIKELKLKFKEIEK